MSFIRSINSVYVNPNSLFLFANVLLIQVALLAPCRWAQWGCLISTGTVSHHIVLWGQGWLCASFKDQDGHPPMPSELPRERGYPPDPRRCCFCSGLGSEAPNQSYSWALDLMDWACWVWTCLGPLCSFWFLPFSGNVKLFPVPPCIVDAQSSSGFTGAWQNFVSIWVVPGISLSGLTDI